MDIVKVMLARHIGRMQCVIMMTILLSNGLLTGGETGKEYIYPSD